MEYTVHLGKDTIEELKNAIHGEDDGGEGGSSEFSTAKVRFIASNTDNGYYKAILPMTFNQSELMISIDISNDDTFAFLSYLTFYDYTITNEGVEITLPLVNGKCILSLSIFAFVGDDVPILEGGVELTEDGILITGNGSITIKGIGYDGGQD